MSLLTSTRSAWQMSWDRSCTCVVGHVTLVVTGVDGSQEAVGHLRDRLGEEEATMMMGSLLVVRLRVVGGKTTGRSQSVHSRTSRRSA
jgi:hypothetical protein